MTPTVAELTAHPERLDKDTLFALRELVARYPYYQAARLLFLKTSSSYTTPLSAKNCAAQPSTCQTDACSSIWSKGPTINSSPKEPWPAKTNKPTPAGVNAP